ncbi:MAG TPA: hypothetical protein PLW01_11010 [Agitococcus sp.]|nr:hypothetical protein [Agitococcus sp.]
MLKFKPNKMLKSKNLTNDRLSSILKSQAFREYSLRKLEEQEQATKEATQKLNEQLKAVLEQKAINLNTNKPKLSLKRPKSNGDANA